MNFVGLFKEEINKCYREYDRITRLFDFGDSYFSVETNCAFVIIKLLSFNYLPNITYVFGKPYVFTFYNVKYNVIDSVVEEIKKCNE